MCWERRQCGKKIGGRCLGIDKRKNEVSREQRLLPQGLFFRSVTNNQYANTKKKNYEKNDTLSLKSSFSVLNDVINLFHHQGNVLSTHKSF